jgi:CRP-like cAMP-binding protein
MYPMLLERRIAKRSPPAVRRPAASTGRLSPRPESNALLARITSAARCDLLKVLKPTVLTLGDVVYDAHETIEHVYFPLDCLVSLLVPMQGHPPIEVAVVGREGIVGVPLVLGRRRSLVRAVVQGSGNALFTTAQTFRDELARELTLRRTIDDYIHGLLAQLTQTAACNAFHPIEARCARALLMARDRLKSDELELTHQVLAQMLGVRRVGVTVAAGNLQRRGVIAYSRGRVVILDPKRLAEASCECYRVIRNVYDDAQRPLT